MERNTINEKTILIVDDIPSNIIALQSLLEKKDRNFLNATNGSDALKLALNKSIDLIMLDVQMAEMDGFEVAQLLKSNTKTKDIPIIFVSATRKEHMFILKGFEEGAVDYLSKPLDPEITQAKVSILLKLQQQKKELVEKNLSLEKSAMLINNSADILGVLGGTNLIFEEVNQAFQTTLEYSDEEVIGISLFSLINEESKQVIEKVIKNRDERVSFEIPVSDKSGNTKWLQWHVTIKDGKWFVNARDISKQKLADDKIRQLNADLQENLGLVQEAYKELDAFSYSISHDLRAPLRSINNYSQALEEDHGHQLDEEAKKLLATIQKNAGKMSTLIDDLLEFSKLGRKEVKKTEIDTRHLITEVLDDMKQYVTAKTHIHIKNLLPVLADRALLTQVFINLISNALKYSGKKAIPEIEIDSYHQNNEVVFYVMDNGIGFNMQYIDKLFNVFQRLHSDKEFEGTGVGLAMVNRIINKHGGKVWAEAKVNEGAKFYFTLPE